MKQLDISQIISEAKLAKFRDALCEESTYPSSDAIYNYLINEGEVLILKKHDVLIGYGQVDANIYFILDGIICGTTVNEKGIERTVGFGCCGTMICSMHCYAGLSPSIYQYQACSRSIILKISKKEFDKHIDDNHEFAKFVLGCFALRIFFNEKRNDGMNGDALSKYKWLTQNRPEIISTVSDKVISSYLNITSVHLSRIKSKLIKG